MRGNRRVPQAETNRLLGNDKMTNKNSLRQKTEEFRTEMVTEHESLSINNSL